MHKNLRKFARRYGTNEDLYHALLCEAAEIAQVCAVAEGRTLVEITVKDDGADGYDVRTWFSDREGDEDGEEG
jgi:hypothetical protein